MARNIDDPALLSSFLQKSQQYFEPKKPKDTSANLKTVQSEVSDLHFMLSFGLTSRTNIFAIKGGPRHRDPANS